MTLKRNKRIQEHFLEEWEVTLKWTLEGILQALFLTIWVLTQWFFTEFVFARFSLYGIDKIILIIYQWLFAFASAVPIALRIIDSVATMLVVTYRNFLKKVQN